MTEERQEDGLLLDHTIGKYCRVYCKEPMGPTRCLVKGIVRDPDGRPFLQVQLPGKIKTFLAFEIIVAAEVFESFDQLKEVDDRSFFIFSV